MEEHQNRAYSKLTVTQHQQRRGAETRAEQPFSPAPAPRRAAAGTLAAALGHCCMGAVQGGRLPRVEGCRHAHWSHGPP
eukprot:5841475-Lingulodinium_polyedra.AAC.1